MPKSKNPKPEVPNVPGSPDPSGSATNAGPSGAPKTEPTITPPDRGGNSPGGGAAPMVGVESVKPLAQTPTTERPVRVRRTKVQIEADKISADNAAREANAESLERLRKDTHATVSVFIKGFNPLFTHIIPPPLDPEEHSALAHVWTMYMIKDGVEIPVGKAAVALSCIIIIPRVILGIVDWVMKRRDKAKLAA